MDFYLRQRPKFGSKCRLWSAYTIYHRSDLYFLIHKRVSVIWVRHYPFHLSLFYYESLEGKQPWWLADYAMWLIFYVSFTRSQSYSILVHLSVESVVDSYGLHRVRSHETATNEESALRTVWVQHIESDEPLFRALNWSSIRQRKQWIEIQPSSGFSIWAEACLEIFMFSLHGEEKMMLAHPNRQLLQSCLLLYHSLVSWCSFSKRIFKYLYNHRGQEDSECPNFQAFKIKSHWKSFKVKTLPVPEEDQPTPKEMLQSTWNVCKNHEVQLMMFTMAFSGLEMGFWQSIFPTCVGATKALGNDSDRLVGLAAICCGVGEILSAGILFWKNQDKNRGFYYSLVYVFAFIAFFLPTLRYINKLA